MQKNKFNFWNANANRLIAIACFALAGYCFGGLIGLGVVAVFVGIGNLL